MSKNQQLADILATAQYNNLDASGNLNFSGAGQRIKAPFGGALANRLAFQNNSADAATLVASIPSGSATNANFMATNSSDISNGSYLSLDANSSVNSIISGTLGSGSALPLGFSVGGSERLRIDTAGNVTLATSPAQFDNTTKVATTAFVKQALGQYRGDYQNITANKIFSQADAGILYSLEAPSLSITIPLSSTCVPGTTFLIRKRTGANAAGTISGADFQTINFVPTTAMLYTIVNINSAGWIVLEQSDSDSFGASLTGAGYQKLPSGLIAQWGIWSNSGTTLTSYPVNITFPIAFPTNCFIVTTSVGVQSFDYDISTYRDYKQSVSIGMPTTAGFEGQIFLDNAIADGRIVQWLAIGH